MSPYPSGARVDVQHLTWRPFGRREPVLADICLTIEPGEHVLLAGPSGSGKSTLLRALAGVLTTTESGDLSGRVDVGGAALAEAAIGLLVQDPTDAMVASRVGRDVAFGLENAGTPQEQMWGRIRESLRSVTFPYGTEHAVQALSGGEAQRLALAGVLVMRPGLVLLDEPTSMLDPVSAAAVRRAVRDAVVESGATMIIVEHELEPWLALVDRIVILGPKGVIRADGPPGITLQTGALSLASQGVWVPGVPAPTPVLIPDQLCAPMTASPRGRDLIQAQQVSVRRTDSVGLHGGSGGRSSTQILTDVTAVARAGEIVAVVGASGAGKSTLAAAMAGLEPPSSGEVTAALALRIGTEVRPAYWRAPDIARRIGWVPQQAELAVIGRTVREDALVTCRAVGLDKPTDETRVDELLGVLGLSELADTDPHHLSGGELRRLALVGAIAHGPSVLVLDEPTVGQDRQTWAAVAGVIIAARSAGVAVFVTTHDPLLIRLADRTITLKRGREVSPTFTADVLPTSADDPEPSTHHDYPLPPYRRRGNGLAGYCGPLSLLGASLALLIGALVIADIRQALAGIGAWLVLSPLITGWNLRNLRRLVPGMLAVASVGFSTWLLSAGHNPLAGATAGLRIAFFVLPGVYLATYLDPSTLGDHLVQRLRLPARPVIAATAALQQFENLARHWQQLRRSRRMRGIDGGRSPAVRGKQFAALVFELLIHTVRKAGRMTVAMEARGFSSTRAARPRRTWAEPAPWHVADSILLAAAVTVAFVPALVGWLI